MTTDYEQSGIRMDAPSVRISRLEESLEIIRAMWRDGSATFAGEHYDVHDVVGSPKPVTPGGPPVVIGGGSKRILTLAGRRAEVVSIVPSLAAGHIGREVAAESVVEKYRERVRWARDAAGPRADELELQCWTVAVQVVPNATEIFESMAPLFDLTPDQLRAAPLALIGTAAEISETLRRRRAELGFSYIVVHEAEFEALAPVVAELAGT
jgi:alkanesulfonate monooxygenase SsuD/methylene tetrahydromethanopterin reductase-like flavin-dependent oxidoreductase (luciferase family)